MQSPSSPNPPAPPQKKSFKRRLVTWFLVILGILFALFFLYRTLGSSEYRATVQRVYEKEGEYRVEFRDRDGKVHVAGNHDMNFPYVKVDSADLHAELHHFAQKGDTVKVKIWGFRLAWFSVFPNVISAEFAESRAERTRKQAEQIADAVLRKLLDKGVLKGGDGLREDVIQAVEESLDRDAK